MRLKESFRRKSAQYLYDKGMMFEFLPVLNPHSRKDMRTLQVWCEHLASQNIPYLVEDTQRKCQDGVMRDNVILWKERRVYPHL